MIKASPYISITRASEHNLKDVSLDIPRDQLVVVTGVSGSGKSSLAFDTIFAEGQRRYLESLSAYARQFMGVKEKPKVEKISGLSPVIAIDQQSSSRNPRSTVATVTEIYDYLRLLFARVGVAHDPDGQLVQVMSHEEIVKGILALPAQKRYLILAPVVLAKKGQHAHIPAQYQRQGFAKARVDGVIYALDEFPTLDKNKPHTIEIVVDRLQNDAAAKDQISQAVEAGLQIATGFLLIIDLEDETTHRFSQKYYNPNYPDFVPPEMEPRTFSFNSPFGACATCSGLGRRLEVDPELVLNPRLTLAEGAVRPISSIQPASWSMKKIEAVAQRYNFSTKTKVADLETDAVNKILYGTADEKYEIHWMHGGRYLTVTYEGIIPWIQRLHQETESDYRRAEMEKYMVERACYSCRGQRLNDSALSVKIAQHSIADVTALTVADAQTFFKNLQLTSLQNAIAESILPEIAARLNFMVEVGLDYLTLDRAANTLSGGEAQRIRLATQIGSGLQGVLYVLDEPSIGLHKHDHQRLLQTLQQLRNLGNSLLIVEHDEDTIRCADYVIDIGPGAGVAGGAIMATGTPQEITQNPDSLTGQYLSGQKQIVVPKQRRAVDATKSLKIVGATQHNLKNLDVTIPLGVLVTVAGPSGSGKSTLINSVLAAELQVRLNRATQVAVGRHQDILGCEALDKIIIIDQSAIGRTPRSNPATYVGLYTDIRALFASLPLARERGYKDGRFSFNVTGGRCEVCRGEGALKKEMHFLPDIFVTCEACAGKRYMQEVLEVYYKGKNIADVLEMPVTAAVEFFANLPSIHRKLLTLQKVGLGYIALGQPATTLSGGEAQRIKLAKELSRRPTGRTLYILDEPTTGLHMDDIRQLLQVLHALVDAGNSMIIIEHNLDILKNADYLIDMGPKGGQHGGTVVACGTPEVVAQQRTSVTGQFLQKVL